MSSCFSLSCTSNQMPSTESPPEYIRAEPPAYFTGEPTPEADEIGQFEDNPYYRTTLELPNQIGIETMGVGDVYWLSAGQPFSATLTFDNGTTHDLTYTLLCMIDYQQVPCMDTETAVRTTMPSGERSTPTFAFEGLEKGVHVLTLAAMPSVPVRREFSNDRELLADLVIESPSLFWSADATLFVETYSFPELEFAEFPTGPSSERGTGSPRLFATTISDTLAPEGFPHPNMLQEASETFQAVPLQVQPGATIQFYLMSAHDEQALYYQAAEQFGLGVDQTVLPMVITTFIDTRQVPLNSDFSNGPVYTRIPRGEEVVIPVSITAPEEPGIYSFYAIYQEGPYLPEGELIPQEDGGVIYEYFGDLTDPATTNRVVFEVIP